MPKDALDELILKLAVGDRSALDGVYMFARTPVYSYALSLLKSTHDAEDVLQDTLLEVWRSAPRYKSMGKPMAWIITIARSFCLKKLGEVRTLTLDEVENVVSDSPLPSEDAAVIRACMEKLCEDEREIILLHAAGLKHREIAKILNRPLSTVLSRYQRAVKKLQKELEGAL